MWLRIGRWGANVVYGLSFAWIVCNADDRLVFASLTASLACGVSVAFAALQYRKNEE